MARAANTFRDELVNAGLHATEAAAITAWANAHSVYFADSVTGPSVAGVPVNAPAVATATAAMAGAMAGLSMAGAVAIQTGITAFWSSLVAQTVATPGSVYAGAIAITPPPGLANIAADILLAAPVNVANKNDAETALGFIVGGGAGGNLGIHTLTLTGATATFPPSLVATIL